MLPLLHLRGDQPLPIAECTRVATGTKRIVYEHPAYPGLLIKTINPDALDAQGNDRTSTWWKKKRPFGAYGVFLREFSEYVIQCRRRYGDTNVRLPFAPIRGMVMTTEGLGMIVDRVADSDGGLSPTMHQLVATSRFTRRHLDALERFLEACDRLHVVFGDMHAGNLAYTEARDLRGEFIAIDGFGEKSLVPVHRWSRWINSRKIDRVRRRLLAAAKPAIADQVGDRGLEPMTPSLSSWCSSQLS